MIRVQLGEKYMLYSLAELEEKYGKDFYKIDPGITHFMIEEIWRNDRYFHPVIVVKGEIDRDVICSEGEKEIKSDIFLFKDIGDDFYLASWMIKGELNLNRLKLSENFNRFKKVEDKLNKLKGGRK